MNVSDRVARRKVETEAPAQFGGAWSDDKLSPRARVLVVDDDERNLLAIRTVIEDLADVVIAQSGDEALRHLLKGDFAVILLDVYMPGMDGYETAQMIRGREQTKRIPIVFLSAVNKEYEHLMRGYSMGAVDYVFKPVEPIILRSKVSVFVDLFTMTLEIQRKAAHEQHLLDANLRANAERLRAEQDLRLAEQRQAAVIRSLPIAFYVEPVDELLHRPRFVSGNFAALTGFEIEAVHSAPTSWIERIHPDDRERVLAILARGSAEGGWSIEYRWQCADGSYKHFLDQTVLTREADGGAQEFAGTLLDVTDRKELELQLAHARKMDAIGQLTGGIAHDFNNVLAAILGGVGLIERRVSLTDEQRRIVTMTKHAAEQGAELVRRLLAFARRQKLDPISLDVETICQSVSELMAHTLGGLVQLDWSVTPDIGPVYADPSQLELALMNLIINARDAMPEGGVINLSAEARRVEVESDLGLVAGDYIVMAVSDTGSGIPSEILDKVLEPFFSTKKMGKGTGLGLSMVYGFVQQSGGNVSIDSSVGQGTRVEIWLPASIEAPIVGSGEITLSSVDVPQTIRRRILLVDDHEGVRATTKALLQEFGHEVEEAEGAARALAMLENDPSAFDLLVTDYAMPMMSGGEFIERARRLSPSVPAIIMTGYMDTSQFSHSPDGVEILSKPFSVAQLARVISTALNLDTNDISTTSPDPRD